GVDPVGSWRFRRASHRPVSGVMTKGAVEPQFVLEDSSANVTVHVVIPLHGVRRSQTLLPQRIVDVVGGQAVVLTECPIGAVKIVAARLHEQSNPRARSILFGAVAIRPDV